MVNYLYDLKRIDKHRSLLAQGKVPASGDIDSLAATDGRFVGPGSQRLRQGRTSLYNDDRRQGMTTENMVQRRDVLRTAAGAGLGAGAGQRGRASV